MKLDGDDLPRHLYWSDETEWDPVAQQRERAIDGTLHLQESTRYAGRPVTLTGAWVTRAELLALREKAENAGTMTLELDDGRELDVRWRRERRRPAVHGEPLFPVAAPGDGHQYSLTLRFIEV